MNIVKRTWSLALLLLPVITTVYAQNARQPRFPRFKIIAFYNERVEPPHVDFAHEAIAFFKDLTIGNGFVFDATTDMNDLHAEKLAGYDIVMMLNDVPHGAAQRRALEEYMKNGGAWWGFHVAAYNDRHTQWPWLLELLGGGVFWRNSWPAIPAKLTIDDPAHPVAKAMPASFIAPSNEWYQWTPSPRQNPKIKVLASLSPENYPLGIKDIVPDGDLPVVWTNTDYRMIYFNMGHCKGAFDDATQNQLFVNALQWLAGLHRKTIVAYVTSWSDIMPDPAYMTHINYAFGHVNRTFDGIRIDNPDRLRALAALKQEAPQLRVLLSIGGWGSGRFSEMAAVDSLRIAFSRDCRRIIDEFGLDGIDIDWEYPTSSGAGISHSPEDTKNYTLLMRDIRAAIGNRHLLTLASSAGAGYIDFPAIEPCIDFVNIMTYDMGQAPKHHAAMYRSEMTGWKSCDEAVAAHRSAGLPASKLVLGVPFYGRARGDLPDFIDYAKITALNGYTPMWDDTAKCPYLTNSHGDVVCSYETPQSIAIKCQYVIREKLRGMMYWDYAADDADGTLRKSVYNGLNQ
ncbi:MAG: ThuA domain-containing protein [Prevotellaceae bacterium]|jgi:chitinase|nr:ThuA domain-containing protein [Prevotellaceae bacterium]